jgi:hypothetical protein
MGASIAFRAPSPDFLDLASPAPRFAGAGAAADDVSTTSPSHGFRFCR